MPKKRGTLLIILILLILIVVAVYFFVSMQKNQSAGSNQSQNPGENKATGSVISDPQNPAGNTENPVQSPDKANSIPNQSAGSQQPQNLSANKSIGDMITGTQNPAGNPENPVQSPDKTNSSSGSSGDGQSIAVTFNVTKVITVANWNLQVFGQGKASNQALMDFYASKIEDYDIVFIQEIRDAGQTAFPRLCSLLPEYNCLVSSRAGRTSSKEQYGVIYEKWVQILDFKDYNPDALDRWERPPIAITFNASGLVFTAFNLHTKPTDTTAELQHLEELMPNKTNIMLLGDFNADCSYYDRSKNPVFTAWHWIIGDKLDTTVSGTNCAYDRIILDEGLFQKYAEYGIDSAGINSSVSDHYLVWARERID